LPKRRKPVELEIPQPRDPQILPLSKAPAAIAGLNEISNRALPWGRTTIACGDPGSGKTMKRPVRKKTSHTAKQNTSQRKMYSLHLYVTGQTPRSAASIRNLRDLCDEYLEGRFELEVIDLYQRPELAKAAHVVAAPTLIKRHPLPLRRLVGDLSDKKEVLLGLGLKE
jgi:circadian clock protein KaiB